MRKGKNMQLNTGAKIWLWFALVVNVISFIVSIPAVLLVGGIYYLLFVLEIGMIAGVAVMLFTKKKLGYFVCCGCGLITFILNLILGVNIISAVWGLVGFPLITYLVLKSQWKELG